MGFEADIARRVMEQSGLDPESPMVGSFSGSVLAEWIALGVAAGFKEAALAKPPIKIEKSTAKALGTKKGSADLTEEDLIRLAGYKLAVFDLLKDGRRYTKKHLGLVGGGDPSRRARELRPEGFVLKEVKADDAAFHWYWLLRRPGVNYGDYDVSRLEFATQVEMDEQDARQNKGT